MTRQERNPPADDFGWRGILAANLKCWHRLTEIESDELVAFVSHIKEPHNPLTDEWIRTRCDQAWVFETVKHWIRLAEAAHGIKEQP